MQPTRRARLEAVIQEELALVVSRELKDPRIPSVTFTSVQVTQDGSQATVFVSILGGSQDPKAMKDCLAGLTSASGFLRRHLARTLTVRHIPSLIFKEDRGFENALRVHELLKKISDTGTG